MKREVSILTFHSVEVSGSAISTAPEEFDRQLAYLRRLGYTSLSLNDAIRRPNLLVRIITGILPF